MKPFTIYDCLCFVQAGIVRMDVKIASSFEVVLPIDLEILPQQGRPLPVKQQQQQQQIFQNPLSKTKESLRLAR